MGRVVYDVPLVTQAANPICWVTCMAMIASERRGYSVGVGEFTGGFDPSSASIPNPAGGGSDWDLIRRLLARASFNSAAINPDADEVEALLQTCGPFMLIHYCAGFPYGSGWSALTDGVHAVVITGIDSAISGGMCWMNNPWGNKDRPILTSAVIAAIIAWLPTGQFQVAYWEP